jgi:hypothetical protein
MTNPFQRSRQTRNQEAVSRRQGQVVDLDPTDGLPVQKYAFQVIQINQDASADAAVANTKSTNSAEWAAQFNTSQYPWPEAALPSFQKELQPWNQEMIRRARAGNTNAKLSVWDRKTNNWLSASEAGKRATPLKSLHLNNLDSNGNGKLTNGDAESTKSGDEGSEDSSNESEKSGDDEDEDDEAPFKTSMSTKRRKLASRLNEPDDLRTIEIRKWVQLPSNVAEKVPERSFLASRRPGMPPLYTPDYAQKLFGQYHSSATLSGATGYDLGEGGGLNNASGVLAAGSVNAAGVATPPRKNIPPRRKKKKLGGPGRRKANPNPDPASQASANPTASVRTGVGVDGTGDAAATAGVEGQALTIDESQINADNEAGADGEDNESGSEAEGSEEGEIDEGGGANVVPGKADTPTQEAPAPLSAPEVIITDTDMRDVESSLQSRSDGGRQVPEATNSSKSEVKHKAEMFIPGLGEVQDEEEKQIVEENAQAISALDPAAEALPGQSEAISEAIKEAAVGDSKAEVEAAPKSATATEPEEMDLLGAMDAAIDRGMSEGA